MICGRSSGDYDKKSGVKQERRDKKDMNLVLLARQFSEGRTY
jgi:hypothetical protein